jgi:hypothetical protein
MQLNLANSSLNHIPAIFRKIPWEVGQINFDVGGGRYDKATDFLFDNGVMNVIFDQYARSAEHNFRSMEWMEENEADTATLSNVLCVIKEKRERLNLLALAKDYLKPGGKLYVSIYAGDGTGRGKPTKSKTWQNNRPLRTYLREIKEIFPDATLEKGFIIATKGD